MSVQQSPNYQRDRVIYTRCSRCRTERRVFDDYGLPMPKLQAVTVGSSVLGYVCDGCLHATHNHINAQWCDYEGIPFVDLHTGELVNTRCSGCGMSHGECRAEAHERKRCCPECNHGGAP